jgi:hypothetical protein
MRKLGFRHLLCLSLGCAASLSPGLVSAAPAAHAGDDDATVAMARERFKEGVAFFDKKDFDKARLAFLQAYALKKHPAVLLNLAQSELRSGHEADAAKHFSAYLRDATDASAAETQAAEAGLTASKIAVAEVDVSVDESGAEVSVDGTLEGISPLSGPVYLEPGPHSIEARKGSKSTATQINAGAGKVLTATLDITPRLAAPVAAEAPSNLTTSPATGAEAPAAPPATAPEREPLNEPESAPSRGGGRKPFFSWLVTSPVGLVGLGLTGVGVGGGIGFALASKKSYSNANSVADQIRSAAATDSGTAMPNTANLCTNPKAWLTGVGYASSNKTPGIDDRTAQYQSACAKYPDTVHTGDSQKTISTVGFIVGGVAAVGTIILYFVDPGAKESAEEAHTGKRRVALVPTVGPSQTGLTLLGSF